MANAQETVISQINSFYFLSDEQINALEIYVNTLIKWNNSFNLVGKSTEKEIWERHILDSAQLVKYIPKTTKNITDFGAGAGLPSAILAIILPDIEIHAVESAGKKATFMKEAARLTKSGLIVHNERVEKLTPWQNDVVTARAFAPLDKLLDYVFPFCKKEGLCIFPKGCNFEKEVDDAAKNWKFTSKIKDSIISSGNGEKSYIIELSEVEKNV